MGSLGVLDLVQHLNVIEHIINVLVGHQNSIGCGFEYRSYFDGCHTKMSDPVSITAIHPYHTIRCQPNKVQLVFTRATSGDYSKFSLLMKKDLMEMMNLKNHVDTDAIRVLLLRTFSQKRGIIRHDTNNARMKCKMLQQQQIVQSSETNENYKNSNTVIEGLLGNLLKLQQK